MDGWVAELALEIVFLGALLAAFVTLRCLDGAWLREWAAGRGVEILESRRLIWGQLRWQIRAMFANWPLRMASAVYRVTILDRRGERQTGYVMLVRGMLYVRDHVETRWDGEGVTDQASEAIRHYREMKAREQADG